MRIYKYIFVLFLSLELKKYDVFLINIVAKYKMIGCITCTGKGLGWSKKRVNWNGSYFDKVENSPIPLN